MITPESITVVYQGQLPPPGTPEEQALATNLSRLRSLLPGAKIMVGTWRGSSISKALQFDHATFSDDPGPLPNFKVNAPRAVNNVNRQIAGSLDILKAVDTPYTLKLRLDTEVNHVGFLDWYVRHGKHASGQGRIAVGGYFTLDPRMYERMPFHVSDWHAFGPSARVRQLWSAPFMTSDDATWYDRNAHAAGSTWFDRRYRTRLAIEQHLTTHFATSLGYMTPAYHNDVRPQVLSSHDRFMQSEMLVLDPEQYGLSSANYPRVGRSSLQYFNCLGFLDWHLLNVAAGNHAVASANPALHAAALQRRRRKDLARSALTIADPLMPVLRQPVIKAGLSQALRLALRLI